MSLSLSLLELRVWLLNRILEVIELLKVFIKLFDDLLVLLKNNVEILITSMYEAVRLKVAFWHVYESYRCLPLTVF